MIRMIRADIRRIMCKKSLWIAFLIALLVNYLTIVALFYFTKTSTLNFAEAIVESVKEIAGTMIGIIVFLAVYADDFKAMTMICVIGRGVVRWKIILAKFINSVIITMILYAIYAVHLVILARVMGLNLLAVEEQVMWLGVFGGAFLTVGYVTMAAIIIYASGNMPFSLFMLLVLYMLVPYILQQFNKIAFIKELHLERYHFGGLEAEGLSDIVLGMTASGILTLVAAFIIYVGGSLAIIYAIYRKKELDF